MKVRYLVSRARRGIATRARRRLIAPLLRKELSLLRGSDDGEDLFFVTGFDKSGTTWLRLMLDSHPSLVCKSHGHFFNYWKPDAPFLSSPGGYVALTDDVFATKWWAGEGKSWMTEEVVHEHARRLIADALRSYRTREADLVGVKGTVQDCRTIREVFPKAKIIGIVRDGRDVAVSFAYHFSRQPGKRPRFEEDNRLQRDYLEEIAGAWSDYVLHMTEVDGIEVVRYEDLLVDTTGEMQRLCGYLGVSADSTTVATIVQKNSFERLSGGRQEGEEDPSSFYRKGVSGDWEAHLNDEDRKVYAEIAGDALRAWRYEP